MKVTMNLPDDLLARVSIEADSLHMNRTQYVVRSLTQMVEADSLLRNEPDIKAKMVELTEMLSQVRM